MPFPTVKDDGQTGELDLHGASLAEAEDIIVQAIRLASRRGRTTIRIIHGISTSEADGDLQTIRHLLHALLDGGRVAAHVTDYFDFDTSTTVALSATSQTDPRPIRITDLT